MGLRLSDLNAKDVTLVSKPDANYSAPMASMKLSDLDPSDVQLVQEPGMGQRALGAIQSGISKLDSYTGAPVRAAIIASENASAPAGQVEVNPIPRLKAAANAFAQNFGQNPDNAPTGQDIAENLGAPKNSVAAKVAGFGIGVASNPTSYLPVGEMIGGAVKGAGKVVGLGSKAVESASDAAPIADVADKFVSTPASSTTGISRAAGKVAETMTGVDRNIASNYLDNTDRINQIIDHYSGPDGYSEAAHAEDVRNQWRGVIQDTRKSMNNQISTALNGEAGQATVSASPILDKIDSAISKADPATQSKDIATLNQLKSTLGQMTDAQGNVSLKRLHAFKKYAFDAASPAFDGAGNAIFPGGDFAASQAKNIGGTARSLLVDNAPKQVSQAESVLSDLHNAEDTMSSTLLKDNGPVHAISRAGVNPGGIEAKSLRDLSGVTQKAKDVLGSKAPAYNFEQDAKDFATTRAFAAPKFTPDFTGKSVLRAGIGAAAGGLASTVLPIPSEYAALGGAALASPGMLKAGTNLINIGGKIAAAPMRAMAAAPGAVYNAAVSPAGRAALDLGAKGALAMPAVANKGAFPLPADVAQSQPNRQPAAPSRGEDARAKQGIQKLGLQDQNLVNQLLQSPKGKQLLIQASDLPPGSKAMQRIIDQIQKGYGKK